MNPEDQTIAEIAVGNSDFQILVMALEAAGLTGAVADPDADLTVFAPTDAAFAALAATLGYDGDPADKDAVFAAIADALAGLADDGDPIPLLSDILLFHVSPGSQSAEEITASDSIATLQGTALVPEGGRLVDQEPDLLDAEIALADLTAANGVIQVIDSVLLPLDVPGNDAPSIVDIAVGNPDFEVLVLALQAADLVDTLANPNAEFTVFAPTDAGFAQLATDLGFAGDTSDAQAVFDAIAGVLAGLDPDGDPIPLLTDILLYHVVDGAQSQSELIGAAEVTTLNGSIVIPSESGIFDVDPQTANAAFVDGLTDIAASNGTVQVVDRVLLPLDLDNPDPAQTIAGIVAASGDGFDQDVGDFDVLLAALQAADLVDALSNPDDSFTVFAPTDAAFIELAETFGAAPADEAEAFTAIVDTLTALSADGDPVPLLTNVLLYHVVQGEFGRVGLADGPALTSLLDGGAAPVTGSESLMDVDTDVADPLFIDAASDIDAANGIVQAIDSVLLPIDVPEAVATGSDGDDTLTVNDATTAARGGDGFDTLVFTSNLEDAAFERTDNGFEISVGDQSIDVTGIESFQFADQTLELDESAAAASVARLYLAGFGRESDFAGQAFNTAIAADAGILTVAEGFVASPEFASLYGDVLDSTIFLTSLYDNVLGRAPDPLGEAFWSDELDSGRIDVASLLVSFSESAEFQDQTEAFYSDGVLTLV